MSLRWMSRSASGAELSPEVVASMLTAAIQGGDGATASMVVADAARSGHLTASMANRGIEDCLEQGLLGAAVSFHATARDNEVLPCLSWAPWTPWTPWVSCALVLLCSVLTLTLTLDPPLTSL